MNSDLSSCERRLREEVSRVNVQLFIVEIDGEVSYMQRTHKTPESEAMNNGTCKGSRLAKAPCQALESVPVLARN